MSEYSQVRNSLMNYDKNAFRLSSQQKKNKIKQQNKETQTQISWSFQQLINELGTNRTYFIEKLLVNDKELSTFSWGIDWDI